VTPTEVLTTTGAYPSYHNRADGHVANSDVLDMTFAVSIDFLDKSSGTRELIWETGAGTVGTSVTYESPSTIVFRSAGNGGFSLLTVQHALSAGEIAAGSLEIGWTYDALNANGTQTGSIIVNGQIVASGELDVGGDWSGGDGARFGVGGNITGNGANGTITSVAFASGTIDLARGLEYYCDTLWLPVADDTDGDGIPDVWEELFFPGDLTALDEGQDNDGDDLDDDQEFENNTDPTVADTDMDGLDDGREANSANPDFTATDPTDADSDDDGREDGEEVTGAPTSDPNDRDTDGDRYIDGIEASAGTDPEDANSRPAVGDFLTAYWPLDSLDAGGAATVDLGGAGYDLTALNLDSSSVVSGRIGNAVAFDAAAETILWRPAAAGESLPISQHQDYTVSMWVNVTGTDQNNRRMFSEGATGSDTPQFNLGTHNTGMDNKLDVWLRSSSENNMHQLSTAEPLDGTWHHIAWVRYGESVELYIDGVLDATLFGFVNPFEEGLTNTTAIGGSFRAFPSNWVTGMIDDVSLWTAALRQAEITALASGMAADKVVEDGDSDGMPDAYETAVGLDPADGADAALDNDSDTLTNLEEYQRGTDPNVVDTDGDSLPDGVETNTGIWVSAMDTGTSPRLVDSDNDDLNDNVENPDLPYDAANAAAQPGTDPNINDTDEDLVSDGAEVAGASNPTSTGSVPMPEAFFSWCLDDEPLGDTFGADSVIAASGTNPPSAGLEQVGGTVPVVTISVNGAGQTGLAQALDFDGVANCTITPEPNALNDMLGDGVRSDATLEFMISPDSLTGGNQYIWESGGTGDGHGLVLVGRVLSFGVNSANNVPNGRAIASIDLADIYGGGFNSDDYLLVRALALPEKEIALGVTHLGTGVSLFGSAPWTGNSWDGGDPLALGKFQGGRGGDRTNQLSNLPGASATWAAFDGQVAKVSVYPGVLPAVVNVNTTEFEIIDFSIDPGGLITIVWNSFPDESYSVFSSTDLRDFEFEIADGLISEGQTTSFTFQNQQPGEPRIYFRVAKEQ